MEEQIPFKLEQGPCRYGQLLWPADDQYLGKSLSMYGEWAQNEINFAEQFISADATVIDIGGNIGTHAIAFSRMAPSGKIISLEPHREIFLLLKTNISNCNCNNVKAINAAASSKSLSVELSINTPGNFGDFRINAPCDKNSDPAMRVDAITIDSLMLGKVDFIKIDAEGHEIDIVNGAKKTIQKFKPVVMSEILSISNGLLLFKQFNELGYDTYFTSFNPFSESNYNNNYKNIFPFTIEIMLLFIPCESPYPIPGNTYTIEKVCDEETLAAAYIKEKSTSNRVKAKLYFGTKNNLCEDYSIPCMVDACLPGSKIQFRFKLPHEPIPSLMLSLPDSRCALRYLKGRLFLHNGRSINLLPDMSNEDYCSGSTYYWLTKSPNLLFTKTYNATYETAIFEVELLLYGTVELPAIEYLIKLEMNSKNEHFIIEQNHFQNRRLTHDCSESPASSKADSSKNLDGENICNVERIREILEPYFDQEFYFNMYPDVKATGSDALNHYIETGWLENRDPHPEFSTSYYLEQFPDVAKSGMNPFYHWVLSGTPDEKNQSPSGMQKILIENNKLQDANLYKGSWEHLAGMPVRKVVQKVVEQLNPENPRLVLTFGHDNYLITVGGIQIITALEQKKVNERLGTYLQLHPVIAHSNLLDDRLCDHYMLSIILDGSPIGICRGKDVLYALEKLSTNIPSLEIDLVIHALLGHSVKLITMLKEHVTVVSATYWIHDYYSICPCYNLLRNNIIYCNAPPQQSAACGACIYGEERKAHLLMINRLFSTYSFTVVMPSKSASELWLKKSPLPYKDVVVSNPLSVFPNGGTKSITFDRPLRVAFMGLPRHHKGWTLFSGLVRELSASEEFQFYLIGKENRQYPPLIWKKVEVTYNNPDAMRQILRLLDIDIVVIWSIWPETFCIAAYEALAAGCYIITSEESGNVAAMVRQIDQGTVFNNVVDLKEAFKSGKIAKDTLSAQHRGIPTGNLSYNALTTGLIFRQSREPK